MTDRDWQVFLLASLPSVGDELAGRLLKHFGSVRRIFGASKIELMRVDGIGKLKVKKIKEILDIRYWES